MIYDYHDEIVNKNEVKDFYNKDSFVGYILDNGTIYKAKNHNVESLSTFFFMALYNLISNFKDKAEILDVESKDPIANMLLNYLKCADYDELVALDKFIKQYNLTLSDLLVGYFRCHLVTRLNKKILTAANNFRPFYNYILMGFKIEKTDKICYQDKKFNFVDDHSLKNDLYMEEMEEMISGIDEKYRSSFLK